MPRRQDQRPGLSLALLLLGGPVFLLLPSRLTTPACLHRSPRPSSSRSRFQWPAPASWCSASSCLPSPCARPTGSSRVSLPLGTHPLLPRCAALSPERATREREQLLDPSPRLLPQGNNLSYASSGGPMAGCKSLSLLRRLPIAQQPSSLSALSTPALTRPPASSPPPPDPHHRRQVLPAGIR